MTIVGTIKYIEIGTGFWGIIADDGTEYRPLNLPKHYQVVDTKVMLRVKRVTDHGSIHMWGEPVKIL